MKKILLILCLILIPVSVNAWVLDTQNAISNFTMPSGTADFNGTLGADSIVNGTFATDASWTKGAGWTIAAGTAVGTATTGNLNETASTVVAGKFYMLTFDAVVTTGTFQVTAGGWTSDTISVTGTTITRHFYSTTTGAVTFDGVSAFTGTIDNVTLQEISAYAYWDHLYMGTSNTMQPMLFKRTLNAARGDEIAFHFAYQTNKATGGNDTGIVLEMLDTASPGTSKGFIYKVGGTEQYAIDSGGNVYVGQSGSAITAGATTGVLVLQTRSRATAATMLSLTTGTYTHSSGEIVSVSITPTHNQSGTASAIDQQIKRTETALGSGNQYFQTMETAAGFVRGFTNKGHEIVDDVVAGTYPSISTCGTTPALTAGSTDAAGIITVGSGVTTACTVTFGTAYTNEPSCVVTPQGNVSAYFSAKSNSAFTVTFSADMASAKFDYHCIGINGGI